MIISEEARGGLQAPEIEIVRIGREPRGDLALGRLDVHVVEREARADGVRADVLGVHGERVLDERLGGIEVHRLGELDARHEDDRIGVLRLELEHRSHVPLGARHVELREHEPRVPHVGADVPRVVLLCRAVRVIGVVPRAKELRRASDERHADGVFVLDGVSPVIVGERHQRRVRVRTLAHRDEELAEHDAHLASAGVRGALVRLEELDRVLALARVKEDVRLERCRVRATSRRCELRARGFGFGVLALERLHARELGERIAARGARDGFENLLGLGVVALGERVVGSGEGTRCRHVCVAVRMARRRARRGSRGQEVPAASTVPGLRERSEWKTKSERRERYPSRREPRTR